MQVVDGLCDALRRAVADAEVCLGGACEPAMACDPHHGGARYGAALSCVGCVGAPW